MSDDLIGRKLGEYEILSKLGAGGMATVFRARQDGKTEDVALKVMAQRLNISDDLARRFAREARVMQSFDHPNILPVYDFGKVGEYTYLTMMLLDTGALHHYLQQHQPGVDETVGFLDQVAQALDYAHEREVVHRDLKPSNILIGEDGHIYLADFGIAKLKEESIAITPADMLLGTPGYMAPEQWRTEPVDARTDVYAFGVMTYEILCGKLPFHAPTPFSLMYSHLDKAPPLLSNCRHDLPQTVDTVVRRAMAKIAERRYPSAGAFIAALKLALEDEAPAGPGPQMADGDTFITPLLEDSPTTQPRRPELTPITEDDLPPDADHRTTPLQGETIAFTKPPSSRESHLSDPYQIDEEYSNYSAVDVGARSLLQHAREAVLESSGEDAELAKAVVIYVQDMRETAANRTNPLSGPYRALESYDIGDHRLFFGREEAIEGMLTRSPEARFTVLHAESGAGKTSLLRAGIMARLLAGGYLSLYVAVRRRPPQEALKRVLISDTSKVPSLIDQPLRTYFQKLFRMLNRDIFVFIDQFETFFTDVFSDAQRAAFVSEIAECLDDPLLPVHITLALRTEYFGLMSSFQPEIAQPFANEMLLHSLTQHEAKRALLLPARLQNYEYDDGMVELILDDLADASGEVAPPQLQLVGGALIDGLPQDRKLVTHADYQEAGGAEGILRSYLERLLARIPPKRRTLARRVIEGLVRADQTRDVRTPASLHEEISALGIDTTELATVLDTLRENRVLRLVEVDDGSAYELVHDYLALQVQLDPETAARKAAQELLERRVADYIRYGSLLTEQELDVIGSQLDQLAISEDARQLIDRTRAVQQRQRRIARALTVATIVGVIGVLGLGLFAALRESQNQRERFELAQTSEARVTSERDTARLTESRMLADLASQQLTIDPMTSINLAVEALTPLDRPYVPEAEFALSRALQISTEELYMPSERRVDGALWNEDESRILTWSRDGSARVFDSTNGEPLLFLDHDSPVIYAAWSPDESLLLTAEFSGTAYIRDAQTGDIVQSLAGHTDVLGGAVWNNTGDAILTWSQDGSVIVWDLDGQQTATVEIMSPTIARWGPDDKQILTVNDDRIINVWDAVSGDEVAAFDEHVNTVRDAIWNADGTEILSWSDDRSAIVWDVQEGAVRLRFDTHRDTVTDAAWSPDETQILTTSFAGEAIIWDAESGEEVLPFAADDVIDGGVWSPEGQQVVLYGEPSATFIWDMATNENIALDEHTDTVLGANWNGLTGDVLTYSQDGTARVWDTESGQTSVVFSGHPEPLTAAHWSKDGKHILTSGADGSARLWAVRKDEGVIQTLSPGRGQVFAAVWSPDETMIASGHQDGSVYVWDAETYEILLQVEPHSDAVRYLVWSPDGQFLATGSDDGKVFSVELDGNIGLMQDHGTPITGVTWNAAGTLILSSGEDGTARVTDVLEQEEALRVQQEGGIWFSDWNQDETNILTTGDDGTVRVWDATSGNPLQTMNVSALPILGARWNQDESRLLVWGFDNRAHIFAADGTRIVQFEGHQDWVVDAMWSADESRIITASSDTTIRIWDVASSQVITVIETHQDSVIGLVSYKDGQQFLSRSVDGTVRAWDMTSGKEVLLLDGHRGRIRSVAANNAYTQLLTASDDGTLRIWETWPRLELMLEDAESTVTRSITDEAREQFFLISANSNIQE